MKIVFFVSSSILFAVLPRAEVGIAERACGSLCTREDHLAFCTSFSCPEGSRCVKAAHCRSVKEFNRETCADGVPECDIGGPEPCGYSCVLPMRDRECSRFLCPAGTACVKPGECSEQSSRCEIVVYPQCELRAELTQSPTQSPTSLSPTPSTPGRSVCPCKCSFRRSKFRKLKKRCSRKPSCTISRCRRESGRRRRGLQCCDG